MPQRIEKLEAHAGHLLDAFIQLKERYALLHPMLFDEKVVAEHGARQRARGFAILKHSLFLSCVQDIAKLCLDKADRTPSIRKLVAALEDERVQVELRRRFSVWILPLAESEADPEVREALKRIELDEQALRQSQFNDLLSRLFESFRKLETSQAMLGFVTIRDKVSAHTEIQLVADKYQFVDIGELGVKWGDLRQTIDAMQQLVACLGMLIRNASFAWDSLDSQLTGWSEDFWNPQS